MKEAQWGLNCLKGQHQLMIPVERGVNRFHIHVIRGALRINHGAYKNNMEVEEQNMEKKFLIRCQNILQMSMVEDFQEATLQECENSI